MLKPEHFRISASQRGHAAVVADKGLLRRIRECSEKDKEVADALKKVQELGPPRLQRDFGDWHAEQGLILYQGRVYVPKDAELCRDLVQIHHDSPAAGHPGRYKTLELLSRNYWWPGMTKFVNEYVDTCEICKCTKIFPAQPQGPLQPNETPEGPWQIVTSDLIVDLPISDGFDSILVTSDRFSKQVHLTPCNKTLTAGDAATLYIRDIFKHHGTPKKIITDRGPQFASKYLRSIYEGIGIKPSMSTAFHPQTDGQTERWNQEVEQYLRAFTNYRQDDWVEHLPLAEFALNSREHSATGKAPFYLVNGYIPEFNVSVNPMSTVPAANDRLKVLADVREDTKSSLDLAAERMKMYYDRHVQEAPIFQIGDKVWLSAENLKIKQPARKLSHKRLGPYEVLQRVGQLDYKLKLPKSVPVHPVFHVSLLSKYSTSTIPGRKHPEPPPIEVEPDAELEYEVEKILDSRLFRKKLQYLVKWKRYDDSHNDWEPVENVKNSQRLINEFHKRFPQAPKQVSATFFGALNFQPMPISDTSDKTTNWEHGRSVMRT